MAMFKDDEGKKYYYQDCKNPEVPQGATAQDALAKTCQVFTCFQHKN